MHGRGTCRSCTFHSMSRRRIPVPAARYDATCSASCLDEWTEQHRQALALDGVDYVSVPYRFRFRWRSPPRAWYNYNSLFDNSMHADYYSVG